MTRRKAKRRPAERTPQVVLDALHAELEAAEERYRRALDGPWWTLAPKGADKGEDE